MKGFPTSANPPRMLVSWAAGGLDRRDPKEVKVLQSKLKVVVGKVISMVDVVHVMLFH